MGRLVMALALAVALTGCAESAPTRTHAEPTPFGPPSLAEIRCTRDGTFEVLTPRVAASSDGVHVHVRNETGEPVSIGGFGPDVEQADEIVVARTPPGEVDVSCWPYSKHGGPEPETERVLIVDPRSYWVDPELECAPTGATGTTGGSIYDYVSPAHGEKGQPVEIAHRRLNGLRQDDTLEPAGYPDAEYPLVRVLREGRVAAVMNFGPAGDGGWLVEGFSSCPEVGIHDNFGRSSGG